MAGDIQYILGAEMQLGEICEKINRRDLE